MFKNIGTLEIIVIFAFLLLLIGSKKIISRLRSTEKKQNLGSQEESQKENET